LEEARAVFVKHGFAVPEPAKKKNSRTSSFILCGKQEKSVAGGSISKKRDEKVAKKQLDKMEKDSVKSGDSKVIRSTNGRFEAKYTIGDRTTSGARIKRVIELDWKFLEKDKKGNSYYQCLKC
jgi:hypothetical protein